MAGQIFAMGDLDRIDGSPSRLLDYFVDLSGQSNPTICIVSTPSGDNPIYETMAPSLFSRSISIRHFRIFGDDGPSDPNVISSSDLVLVPGGNTAAALAIWRRFGIDDVLREYWSGGGIVGGWSAGSLCWFESGITDSLIPGPLTTIDDCLGFLKGSHCPHFNSPGRKEAYEQAILSDAISEGYAIDDAAAIVFKGNSIARIVSSDANSKAYRVYKDGSGIATEALESELIPSI